MARPKAFDETAVLEKAMQVFWKKGYNAASMEELVGAMGISRASLYDTFGDKKQLYLAALRQFQTASQRQSSAAAARSAGSPKAQLEAVLVASLEESLADTEMRGCLIANATAEMAALDPEVCQFSKKNIAAVEQTFEGLLRAGQAAGEFRSDLDVSSAATFLVNFVHGTRVVSKTGHDAAKMRQSLALAIRSLE